MSEPDEGMYDAINKGLGMVEGEIVSYLNCDEQYLPDTLSFVSKYFWTHPDVDLLFGGALLVRGDGTLIAFRKAHPLRRAFVLADHLYLLTCAMFFRRRIVDEGFRFDPGLRIVGDQDFVARLLAHGYRARTVKRYFAAFTMTGENLSEDPKALGERREAMRAAPMWIRALRHPLRAARWIEKLLSGAYHESFPLSYSIYRGEESDREAISCPDASFRWKSD